MKLKSSQTTRGNEKKKPPFWAFHFLSSLSSTQGVKATQEEGAGAVASVTHDGVTALVLGGGEGKKKAARGNSSS